MKIDKSIVPLYAEEQIINEEQQNIQQILARIEKPIPLNFIQIKLEEGNHICSTKPNWKDKPLSERYGFTHEGEWKQIDIPHELMEKLGLEKGEDIAQPLYLAPQVLNRAETYKGITIENEGEIFLEQNLTIQNLAINIQRWLTEIATLKTQIQNLQAEKETKQQTITNLETELNNSVNRIRQLENLLTETRTNSQTEITQLKEWKNQLKFNLVPLFWPQAFYTEDTPSVKVLVGKVKELIHRPTLTEQEQAQTNFDQLLNQILELEQALTQTQAELKTIPTNWKTRLTEDRQRIIALEGEKEQLNNDWQNSQQQLTQKDNEIIELKKQIEDLGVEINGLKEDSEKEKGLWNKWISDKREVISWETKDDLAWYIRQKSDLDLSPPCSFHLVISLNNIGLKYTNSTGDSDDIKKLIKLIYEYYKNQ